MKRCSKKDRLAVNRLLADESVWPMASEDGTTTFDRYHSADQYLMSEICYVLMPREDIVFIGFPRYRVQYEVHISMLPSARGRTGIRAGRKAIEYMWQNTSARKLVGFIPAYNKAAIKFAELTGFKKEGILSKSFKKDGKMHDMVIFGINKGEDKCHQQ